MIFAGRLREAKQSARMRFQALAMSKPDEEEYVEVMIIRGISHGFLQFPMFLPEGKAGIARCAGWIQESFSNHESKSYRGGVIHDSTNAVAAANRAISAKRKRLGLLSRVGRALLTRSGLGWVIAPPNDSLATSFNEFEDEFDYGSEEEEEEGGGAEEANKESDKALEKCRNSAKHDSAKDVSGGPDGVEASDSGAEDLEGDDDDDCGLIHFSSRKAPGDDGPRDAEEATVRTRAARKLARHTTWEKSSLIQEGELMDRRRSNLVRSLAATIGTDTSSTGSGSEAE